MAKVSQATGYRFAHEGLDVFRTAIELASWIHTTGRRIPRAGLRNQLAAAAESVVLNLCEGTGRTGGSCRNHLEIAFGSAAECHGALSLCKAYGVPGADDALELVDRIRRMLFGLMR